MKLEDLLQKAVLLDIETTKTGKIREVGAVLNNRIFERKQWVNPRDLDELDKFCSSADFVLGHNLLGHDFPLLRAAAPNLSIVNKPIIDTLYLSPLAFPQNPYHRLVKDYKLVRASLSDPIADAKLAAALFRDQWEAFGISDVKNSGLLAFYRFCFEESRFNGFSAAGLASVFDMLGADKIKSPQLAHGYFDSRCIGIICRNATNNFLLEMLSDPASRPIAAYGLAWLTVSGSNSVLPPWVRHRFPEITSFLKKMRETPCGDDTCDFCRESHDPDAHVRRFFGFQRFRDKPATPEGRSLQRATIVAAMGGGSLLAIFPTGGGKSLCFQLPALIRHWQRGLLTVVVSPLQALIKDQVDNLVKNTGTPFAEAIYGLQTPPERGEVLDRVRLGDTAILYIAPEQLRSPSVVNVLRQREIGCWVFDEAHCLSKWGHDFRPDYLYAGRFIREFASAQNLPVSPICCYTATAKIDVMEEIICYFRDELSIDLAVFEGGIERENLTFEVLPVSVPEKMEKTFELLQELLTNDPAGGAIVYASKRKKTEEIRDFLQHQGLMAQAFHGGLNAKEKREIIENFVGGKIPIICATNAFGMGIDKENIRLVLHYEMPGSLENYIQEAGRAGRDNRPARCILLYDSTDANTQFSLGGMSEVKQREIQQMLRALRRAKKNSKGEIIITSDELLRDEELIGLFEKKDDLRDNKVKTAVAWLERSGFLKRNENLTDIFQGKPLVKNIEEAKQVISRLNLSSWMADLWESILRLLFNSPEDRGLDADAIAESLFPERWKLEEMEKSYGLTAAQIVIHALHDMADARILDQGVMLSAILRPKGKNNAMKILKDANDLEERLISLMQEEDPDADNGTWVDLNAVRINQKLKNEGFETAPHMIRTFVKGLSYDGKGLAGNLGSLELVHVSRDRYQVRLQRPWDAIKKTAALRRDVAHVVLKRLIQKAENELKKNSREGGGDVSLSFLSNELSNAVLSDIALRLEVKRMLPAVDRALMFMHEQKVITLQGGMAVLRRAMTIRLESAAKGRRYTAGDFKPLFIHYHEKRFQVHVMMEFCAKALAKIAEALSLVFDYFSMDRLAFIEKYFEDRKELIDKATTQEAYRRIVEDLANPIQISVVGSPTDQSMLILAGPGAGKTTVIIHRCAYLLDVERVPARQILILCFNHNSAVAMRKRLKQLVGQDARGVTVATYHGAAMRIAGISIRDLIEPKNRLDIDFDRILKDAVLLLKGEAEISGLDQDEVRDQLLAGYSHILVDEYQDIDQDQYDLVSAIAGRSLEEGEGRLSILAVGDDDQNIYAFRGANIEFIRKFKEDYSKKVFYLIENYRSTKHIIDTSNRLIAKNQDRMKGDHPICINRQRNVEPPGGEWEKIDSVSQGKVQILEVKDRYHQAFVLKTELKRLKHLVPNISFEDFAILSRTKRVLDPVRSVLEYSGVPVKMNLDKAIPLHRVREVVLLTTRLKEMEKSNCRASELLPVLTELMGRGNENPWLVMLDDFLTGYRDETSDAVLPVGYALERLYEFIAEQRREKMLGKGVLLSTIHAAKGLEFSHVFILDDDWETPGSIGKREEERRILYVAMTRAKNNLVMMKSSQHPNPFLHDLGGKALLIRKNQEEKIITPEILYTYELLGFDGIYMDFAGCFPQEQQIHNHLSRLNAGDEVILVQKDWNTEIHDQQHFCIGRLSAETSKRVNNRISQVTKSTVVAMIRRDENDPDEPFRSRIKTSSWEFPLLEVSYRAEGHLMGRIADENST